MSESIFNLNAFKGKVIGITGGGNGLGLSAVRLLSRLGGQIFVIDSDQKSIAALNDWFVDTGAEGFGICGDIRDPKILEWAIERAVGKWGGLNGWVNNAAINSGKPFETLTDEEFQATVDVNLSAPWRAVKIALPHLKIRKGAIVNVSSIMAHQVNARSSAYSLSKGGLEAFTRSLAVELAPSRIRVNTIRIGHIECNQTLRNLKNLSDEQTLLYQQRFHLVANASAPWPDAGRPENFAQAVAFLLSDASEYITGAELNVDGGYSVALRPVYDERRGQAYMGLKKIDARLNILQQHG